MYFNKLTRGFGLLSLLLAGAVLYALLASTPWIGEAYADAASCAAGLGQPLPAESTGTGLPNRFDMLSWNIQKSGSQDWDTDLLRLGADSDLLFIQEASREAQTATALPQALYQAFAAGYSAGGIQTGVLTLSTVAPSVQCSLTSWEPWLTTPKATNITEFPLENRNQRLLAINLHAVNFSVGTEEFHAQIHTLGTLLDAHEGPVIAGGDFNTWNRKRTRLLESFMASHGLEAVEFQPDLRTTFFRKPLDHVYLRGLRAVSASVVHVSSSDHNPLLVSMELL